jgi:hypothetical protein
MRIERTILYVREHFWPATQQCAAEFLNLIGLPLHSHSMVEGGLEVMS